MWTAGGTMADPITISEDGRARRRAGIAAVVVGLPGTAVAVLLGQSAFSGGAAPVIILSLLFVGVGVWMAAQKVRPRVRIVISDNKVQIVPIGFQSAPVDLPWEALRMIALERWQRATRLLFHVYGDQSVYAVQGTGLSVTPQEVLKLIALRLEMRGQHLAQEYSEVLGAPTDRWHVKDGAGF